MDFLDKKAFFRFVEFPELSHKALSLKPDKIEFFSQDEEKQEMKRVSIVKDALSADAHLNASWPIDTLYPDWKQT